METITIGRDNSCDIVINDSRVSRIHAEVEFDFGSEITFYRFIDKSTNGTIVNGIFIKGQSIEVYRSFYRARINPIEPHIFLAKVIPLSWSKVLDTFSVKFQSTIVKNYDPIEKSSENLNSWNWGAFYFGCIWAISNGIYWPLIEIIPFIGWSASIVIRIVLGINGNKWAWEKRRWESIEHFKRVQHSWAIAALWFFVGSIIFSFMFIIMSLNIISYQ